MFVIVSRSESLLVHLFMLSCCICRFSSKTKLLEETIEFKTEFDVWYIFHTFRLVAALH